MKKNNSDIIYNLIRRHVKLIMIIAIFGLAVADYFAMFNLFEKQGARPREIILFSIIFSACLEGLPTFLGIFSSAWIDNTNYLSNHKKFAKIGFWVCLIATGIAFALVMTLRGIIIYRSGGLVALFQQDGNYQGNGIIDVFTTFSPILTSLLAFAASWFAFKPETALELEARVNELHEEFIKRRTEFLDALHENQYAREAMWIEVSAGEDPPPDFTTFRKEVFARIRAKLTENCVSTYPSQMRRFNEEIESQLIAYIEIMCNFSQVGLTLVDLDIVDILDEFDVQVVKNNAKNNVNNPNSGSWNYELAKKELEDDLIQLLDNAIAVAQFKTVTRPYHLEGDE